MKLFVAGLNHRTAPVEVRERLALQASRLRCLGCRLKLAAGLSEVVILSTCNRVEVYGVGPWAKANAARIFTLLSGSDFDFSPYVYVKETEDAARHLFSVCSGLDSMVIGETEITGQVKQAYQLAHGARLTGKITNRLFQTAMQTAKRIRTESCIGRGATSVGSVAVELAEKIFDQDLTDKTVMIIGAGKMGEACVRHLSKKVPRAVLVANRSYERAENLAKEFGGRAVRFDACLEAMVEADIVVSSTGSPQTILNQADVARVMAARRNRPLFLIDIAVPRDIEGEVQELPNVYLYNVDHLEAIVRENVRMREQELAECQGIIEEQLREIMQRFSVAENASGAPSQPHSEWAWAAAARQRTA